MVARVFTVALVAVLALALIGGSAYILLRQSESEQYRHAQSSAGAAGPTQYRGGQGSSDQHAGQDRQVQAGRGQSSSGSVAQSGNQGRQSAAGKGADHSPDTWVTVAGTVVALEGSDLALRAAEGLLTVNLGAEWYTGRSNFTLTAEDEVEITGYEEDGVFQVVRIVNQTTGETLSLRDETGRPLWAGQGRRGG